MGYIDCDVCHGKIYEQELHITPLGGLTHCVRCWKARKKMNFMMIAVFIVGVVWGLYLGWSLFD